MAAPGESRGGDPSPGGGGSYGGDRAVDVDSDSTSGGSVAASPREADDSHSWRAATALAAAVLSSPAATSHQWTSSFGGV